MKHFSLSPEEFALKIGIDLNSVIGVLNGISEPSLDVIQRIQVTFPDINSKWLLMGEGRFLIPEEPLTKGEFNITIQIDNESFKFGIDRRDEERYRTSAKNLNDKIVKFADNYPNFSPVKRMKLIAYSNEFELFVKSEEKLIK